MILRLTLTLLAACCPLTLSVGAAVSGATRPNLLLVCGDDVKPLLGCNGDEALRSG